MPTHHNDTMTAYKAPRDRRNPHSWITFSESMY
jgi:hypothetical protein